MHRPLKAAAIATLAASTILVTTAACASGEATATATPSPRNENLITPQHLAIDPGLPKQRAALELLRLRELYTFWDTGDTRYLREADSPSFVDHTLPPGRKQGRAGIEEASKMFRAAVPDLRCTVSDMLITGDRGSVRQTYTGHFTGTFMGIKGKGQSIRFIAFDIQQIGAHQIVGDWHLEDNLAFMKQIGAIR